MIYSTCFLYHVLIPQPKTDGYVWDKTAGKPLQYRNNAFHVLLAMLLTFYASVGSGYVEGTVLYDQYWRCFRAAFSYGVVFSVYLYFDGKNKLKRGEVDRNPFTPTITSTSPKTDHSEFNSRSAIEHFYCGIEFNPRMLGCDLKMFMYTVGAVMLQLIVCSCLIKHISYSASGQQPSQAMAVYVFCLTWFIFEYMYHEHVHLFTYDLFRERLGGKLIWGCFLFYPFFYEVGVWSLVDSHGENDLSITASFGCIALFLSGWILTRGANLQKHAFRTNPGADSFQFLFINVEQRTLSDSGAGRKILVSGWWGLSRHSNYLGEIIQGIALALPGLIQSNGTNFVPLLYPLYYVMLFVPRQMDDDVVCEGKYGAVLWGKYKKMVPYRICPWVW